MKLRPIFTALFIAGSACLAGQAAAQDIPVSDAHQKLVAGEMRLVDVRRAEEWAETGTAPGAARITLESPDFLEQLAIATQGNKASPVAFICRSGKRSSTAAEQARAAGYTSVYNVTGGMSFPGGWIEAGLPVVTAGPE